MLTLRQDPRRNRPAPRWTFVAVAASACVAATAVPSAVAVPTASAAPAAPAARVKAWNPFDGVQVTPFLDTRCTQVSKTSDLLTVDCTNIGVQSVQTSTPPVYVSFINHDYSARVWQTNGANDKSVSTDWAEGSLSKRDSASGTFAYGKQIVLTGGSVDFNGSESDAQWGFKLATHVNMAGRKSNVRMEISYKPHTNEMQYVTLTTGGDARCEVTSRSDLKKSYDCRKVSWNVVGDQVSLWLPSRRYRVRVTPTSNPAVRWTERGNLYGEHATGASHDPFEMNGQSVPDARWAGWHLGLESDSTLFVTSFDIDVTYNDRGLGRHRKPSRHKGHGACRIGC